VHWRRAGDCDGGGEYELEHFASSGMRDFISRVAALLAYNFVMLTDDDKQWISQRLEKVETTLLTEFHKWASPVELRQKSHAAALRALDAEVESLSDRLKNLEGR
jgi:hypothetical protein